MIGALHDLKNNIERIEQSHPRLGNDLSATCDRVITELQESHCRHEGEDNALASPASSQKVNTGPLSRAIDRTGDCLISGLDRMGDGIILIFSKIFAWKKRSVSL
jgi:hypothetical protein